MPAWGQAGQRSQTMLTTNDKDGSMEALARQNSPGSTFRRPRTPIVPASGHSRRSEASKPLPTDALLDGLSKHAGPAWVATPDLRTITANPAADARINEETADFDPDDREIARMRLIRMYEDALRSALKTAITRADSTLDARQPAFPQSVSCLIHGEPLDLFVLEVRGTPGPQCELLGSDLDPPVAGEVPLRS